MLRRDRLHAGVQALRRPWRPAVVASLLTLLILLPALLRAQGSTGLVRLVQDGLRHSQEGRHRQAINALEEAWEYDPSNPTVAEHLALSYLYEEHPPTGTAFRKAEELMRFSLESGGRVRIQVRHLHRGWQWVTTIDNSCPGRMQITGSDVHFIAADGNHSFSLSSEAIEEIFLTRSKSSNFDGVFHLRKTDGTHYRMRAGTGTRPEAKVVVQLTREFTIGG